MAGANVSARAPARTKGCLGNPLALPRAHGAPDRDRRPLDSRCHKCLLSVGSCPVAAGTRVPPPPAPRKNPQLGKSMALPGTPSSVVQL